MLPRLLAYACQSDQDSVRNTVYLRPADIVDAFFSGIGRRSAGALLADEQLGAAERRLAAMDATIAPLVAVQDALDARAASRVGRVMWAAAAAITGGAASYFYLCYFYFSWDIMEPVTYFTGLGFGTLSYYWWAATSSELDYTDAHSHLLARSKARLYAAAGFDAPALAALRAERAEMARLLDDVRASGVDPALLQLFKVRHGHGAAKS
jgi:hypothetical protein